MKINLIIVIIFASFSINSQAQIVDTTKLEKIQRDFLSLPSFSIYKGNYFISGTTIEHSPNKYNSDIKYQVSFRELLYRKPLFFNTYPYLSYTQKSFWDIYKLSKPFAEINFNPAVNPNG